MTTPDTPDITRDDRRMGCVRCSHGPFDAVHARRHAAYQHDYVTNTKRHPRAARLCPSCLKDEHAGPKTEIGCVGITAPPPRDYVCKCEKCRKVVEHTRPRSDSEGVIRCRFEVGA